MFNIDETHVLNVIKQYPNGIHISAVNSELIRQYDIGLYHNSDFRTYVTILMWSLVKQYHISSDQGYCRAMSLKRSWNDYLKYNQYTRECGGIDRLAKRLLDVSRYSS